MQHKMSMSSYEPYQETYLLSTSSYESCPTNHLSLSAEELEWMYGCKNDCSTADVEPYLETDVNVHYSKSTSSYESCPTTNHLSLSEEEMEWITTTHDFDKRQLCNSQGRK